MPTTLKSEFKNIDLPFSGGPGTNKVYYPETLKQVCVHCLRIRKEGDLANRHDTACPSLMGHAESFIPYDYVSSLPTRPEDESDDRGYAESLYEACK